MIKWLFNTRRDLGPGMRGLFPAQDLIQEEMAPVIEMLKPGEIGDVRGWRDPSRQIRHVSNVPHVIQYSDGFSWGYGGSGPSDFALNILIHFTHHDEDFSRRHCLDFRDEIIVPLKDHGSMTISAQKILDWIEDRKLKDPRE